jgi:hypothetical protein
MVPNLVPNAAVPTTTELTSWPAGTADRAETDQFPSTHNPSRAGSSPARATFGGKLLPLAAARSAWRKDAGGGKDH